MSLLRRRIMAMMEAEADANLIDRNSLVAGIVLNSADGTEVINASWSTTGYIPIEYGQEYSLSGVTRARYAFYNEEYNLIYVRSAIKSFSAYITSETKYARLSFLTEETERVILEKMT